MSDALHALVDALADLYGAEGRPGGDEAAAALRRHRNDPTHDVATSTGGDDVIRALCGQAASLNAASAVDAAWDLLPWHYTGLSDGRLPEGLARGMLTAELLGHRGPLKCDTCRVGLFAQAPAVDYAARTHAAEETFIMLAGHGEWRKDAGAWVPLGPGGEVHHPSMIPHQSRTNGSAFLAAWRWTGEIGLETYSYAG